MSSTPSDPLGTRPALRLIVTGGGTGGHTYPALTTVSALLTRLYAAGEGLDVLWVGAADSLESRVAAAEGIEFASVVVGRIRRSSSPLKMLSAKNVRDMSNVPRGVAQARKIISDFAADVVLATGGYVAVPVGMAARLCKRPLVVHEQTVRLGLANRLLARYATTVAVSSPSTVPLLPEAARSRAVVTGNPVRPELFAGQAHRAVKALNFVGYNPALPTLYVTGGATGAAQINKLVGGLLPWLLTHANVIHQCGSVTFDQARQRADELPPDLARRYYLTVFVADELPDVLALADVVVSRSGAGTIAELTALGKAAVMIPYPTSAGDEQAHNAAHLARAGAAVDLGVDPTPRQLRDAVAPLLADRHLRESIGQRARSLGRPDAADRLADVVLAAARS